MNTREAKMNWFSNFQKEPLFIIFFYLILFSRKRNSIRLHCTKILLNNIEILILKSFVKFKGCQVSLRETRSLKINSTSKLVLLTLQVQIRFFPKFPPYPRLLPSFSHSRNQTLCRVILSWIPVPPQRTSMIIHRDLHFLASRRSFLFLPMFTKGKQPSPHLGSVPFYCRGSYWLPSGRFERLNWFFRRVLMSGENVFFDLELGSRWDWGIW